MQNIGAFPLRKTDDINLKGDVFPCFNWRIIMNYQWISPNLEMFFPPVSCHILAKRLMSGGLTMEWPGSAEGAAAVRAVSSHRSTTAAGGHPMVSPPEEKVKNHMVMAGAIFWTQSVLGVFFSCRLWFQKNFEKKTCWTTLRTTLNHMADQNSLAFLQRPTMMPSHSWQILHTQKTINVYSSTSYST